MNIGYLTSGRGTESDEVLTPCYAVKPLIKYIRRRGYKRILCPFDLDSSQYVRVFQREGFDVIYSHLQTKDFFTYTKEDVSNVDIIISNPPFSIKDKVLERVYELGKPFALLLPQNSLQGKKRTGLFIKYGLEYLGFDSRICFYTRNELDAIKMGNHFASGYFCKGVLEEKLVFETIVAVQEPYHESHGISYTNTSKEIPLEENSLNPGE